MKKNMIPNLLTFIRMCLVPIMIIFQIFKLYKITIILAIIGALTDLFDGMLARKWNVVSEKGKKLDELADKVFSIGLLICLIFTHKNIILLLILEILIGGLNYYYYTKTNIAETLMIGKIKTTFLFVFIVLLFIDMVAKLPNFISNGLLYATTNLQVLCLMRYYLNYYKHTHKIKEEKTEELTDTIIVDSINDLYDYMKKDD